MTSHRSYHRESRGLLPSHVTGFLLLMMLTLADTELGVAATNIQTQPASGSQPDRDHALASTSVTSRATPTSVPPVTDLNATLNDTVLTSAHLTTAEDHSSGTLTDHNDFTVSHFPVTTTETSTPNTPTTVVTTGCGNITRLPPASSLLDTRTLVLDLSNLTQGGPASCSWTIPALSNISSTVFVFHSTVDKPSCSNSSNVPGGNLVSFGVASPSDDVIYPLRNTCSGRGWKVTNVKGMLSSVIFETSSVNGSAVTLGTYSSFTWTNTSCPQRDQSGHSLTPLLAHSTPQSFHFPGHDLRVPPFTDCTFTIVTNVAHGQVDVRLTNNFTESVNFSCDDRYKITFIDMGYGDSQIFEVPMCRQELDFHYRSVHNVLDLRLPWVRTDAPGFTVTYRAVPAEDLCPATPLQLTAYTDTVIKRYLKGVHSAGVANRHCQWEITTTGAASEDLVVKLDRLFANDFFSHDCNGKDSLTLEDGLTLNLCDTPSFPVWSRGNSTTVIFNAGDSGVRQDRQFLIQYHAVKRALCQGHPVPVTATNNSTTIHVTALPHGDTSGNNDCRWLVKTDMTGHAIQAAVTPAFSLTNCYSESVRAYDDHYSWVQTELHADCPTGENTMVFTSRSQTMLLVFKRSAGYGGGKITVAAVPRTGSGGSRPLVAAILVWLSAAVGTLTSRF